MSNCKGLLNDIYLIFNKEIIQINKPLVSFCYLFQDLFSVKEQVIFLKSISISPIIKVVYIIIIYTLIRLIIINIINRSSLKRLSRYIRRNLITIKA